MRARQPVRARRAPQLVQKFERLIVGDSQVKHADYISNGRQRKFCGTASNSERMLPQVEFLIRSLSRCVILYRVANISGRIGYCKITANSIWVKLN